MRRYVLMMAALALAGCGGADPGKGKPRERGFPVEVAPVEVIEVAYAVRAPGSIEAFEVVPVAARVGGVVDSVDFREGQTVDTATALVSIDAERYRYRFESAKADHAEAVAALADATAALQRRQQLAQKDPGLVAAEEVETFRARVMQAQARLDQRLAAMKLAELEQGWATVRAPVAGEIQERLVRTGQRVETGATVASVLRRDPLLVRLRVTEAEAARLRPGMPATLAIAGREKPAGATLTHVGGAADPATRSVAVLAEVAKEDAPSLRPGAFAAVTIPVGSARHPAIPQSAIRPSERGFLAYVLDGTTARERVLLLGLRSDDGRVEVLSGLAGGEQLVVRGGEALSEGAPVRLPGQEGAGPGGAKGGAGGAGASAGEKAAQ